jgi:hypothetical protein
VRSDDDDDDGGGGGYDDYDDNDNNNNNNNNNNKLYTIYNCLRTYSHSDLTASWSSHSHSAVDCKLV